MLIFACVNWHNYQGRGVEYVNVLFDAVARNLKEGTPGKFVVFTDKFDSGYTKGIEDRPLPQGLDGWWNKLWLFSKDAFDDGDRIVYFDLDTVITNSLDEIAAYDGQFAILRDVYRPSGLQSSVMMWEAGKYCDIWEMYKALDFPKLPGGDQKWIEKTVPNPVILQQKFPSAFVSYKMDARFGIPPKASVVFFHGHPRPHECDGWVEKVWKVGGATSAQLELIGNTDSETVLANIKRSEFYSDAVWLKPIDPHKGEAIICAGGPSLRDELPSILAHKQAGAKVFACNNAALTLSQFGIEPDFHVILDARPQNAKFIEHIAPNTLCLYSSQCDAAVHEPVRDRLILWHPAIPGIVDFVGTDKERVYIGGGTTCGMKTAVIAWTLGYQTLHLYGFDSCYRGANHHAYSQPMNDGEQILDVEYNGKSYRCAPWMVQQAEDFESFAPQLIDHGAHLYVHGSGLIPDIAAQFSMGIYRPEASDFRAMAILERLKNVKDPKVAEIGVFAGDLSRRLLARRQDLSLIMIDSWAEADGDYAKSGDYHAGLDKDQQEQFYHLTKRVTSFAGDRAKIIRKPSEEAAKQIEDNFLDLVFIDADHSYEGCKKDIDAYYDKVKPGGIISGHDYANDDWRFGPMVKRAVDEFIAKRNLVLELDQNFTWFCVKPNEPGENV